MKYWLAKTEPEEYGWDDLVASEDAMWNGVRNYAASNNMQRMAKGDPVFIYHSGKKPAIVGIAEVSRPHYDDPADPTGTWSVVNVRAKQKLKHPVHLSTIKKNKVFAESSLVKNSRLSVHELSEDQFNEVLSLSEKAIN